MSLFDDSGHLLIADTTHVVLYNVDNAVTTVLADLTGTAQNIVKVVPDSNRRSSRPIRLEHGFCLEPVFRDVCGLSVQIDRVYSDKFPSVTANYNVENTPGCAFYRTGCT